MKKPFEKKKNRLKSFDYFFTIVRFKCSREIKTVSGVGG